MKRSTPENVPNDEKGCKKGAEMHPFAPSLASVKFAQTLWNEWRGRWDSNPRPLPGQKVLKTRTKEFLFFPDCSCHQKRRFRKPNTRTDWPRHQNPPHST